MESAADGTEAGAATRIGAEVRRLLAEAVADAERIRAEAERRGHAESLASRDELARRGHSIAASARELEARALRAAESLAAAAEDLAGRAASVGGLPDPTAVMPAEPPVRPPGGAEPVEIRLAETREVRMRFDSER